MPRPRRTGLDICRTKVWYEAVRERLGGVTTAYQVALALDIGTPPAWYQYAAGKRTPEGRILRRVESKLPGAIDAFEKGPNGSDLWAALNGPYEALWQFVVRADPDIEAAARLGNGLLPAQHRFFERLSMPGALVDFADWGKGIQPNVIMAKFRRFGIAPTCDEFLALIALHRLSKLVRADFQLSYLLQGAVELVNEVFGKDYGPAISDFFEHHYVWIAQEQGEWSRNWNSNETRAPSGW